MRTNRREMGFWMDAIRNIRRLNWFPVGHGGILLADKGQNRLQKTEGENDDEQVYFTHTFLSVSLFSL